MDHNTLFNNSNSMWMSIKIPKFIEITARSTANIHMELGLVTGDQMGTVLLGLFGGGLAELAINAISSGQSVTAKILAHTALVSFHRAII